MKKNLILIYLVFAMLVLSTSCSNRSTLKTQGVAYLNGNWFNGNEFVEDTFYEINGFFSKVEPDSLLSSVDIENGYIIPPFGSAHNHNLDRKWQLRFLPDAYLKEGTFYYQNLTSMAKQANELRPFFENDSTLDVVYAQQGITSTLGHPFMVYEPEAMGLGWDTKNWEANMDKILLSRIEENNSYIFIDSISQIDEKLKHYYKSKPDIAKIFLMDVENFETNSKTGEAGLHGLSKEVARAVVENLKENGLTVYAHIETAKDLEFATEIGVDCLAHMPGYDYTGNPDNDYDKHYVDDSAIKKAVSKGIKINPTVYAGLPRWNIKDSIAKANFIKDFLRRYYDAGGILLTGSDRFNKTLTPEIDAFYGLNIFSNRELLKIISYDTPRTIFPKRKIGLLKDGYEASFLVLNENPLENFKAIKAIRSGYKKGLKIF